MNLAPIPRLVVVTDRHTARHPLPVVAERAISGGADVIQVREKDLDRHDLAELTKSVLAAVGEPARVMVNGPVEVARELGVGLHLPEQAQFPPEEVLSELPLIGRSVHSPESAELSRLVHVLIAGHVFPTGSKPGEPPLGVGGLAGIAQAAMAPVLATGGITPDKVGSVLAAGASGIAVLSAINNAHDPESAARAFKQSLEASMSDTQTTIYVTVNGKPATIPAGQTVHDYLAMRGFHDRMVVVELNGQIIRRAAFDSTTISPGDKVEIVHFVGGG